MGRELQALVLKDETGKPLGKILVVPFPVAVAMERTFDLFKIVSEAGGEVAATGINAAFASWFSLQGGLLHDPKLIDSQAMARAVGTLARAFKDGKEFVAWCRSWLNTSTSEGLISKVRFEPAGGSGFVELGDVRTWEAAGMPGTQFEHVDQGVLLSGVFYSIAVNTRPLWHTWGAHEILTAGQQVKGLLQEVKGLLELGESLRELLSGLRSAAASTSGPTESPKESPDFIAK